MVTDWDGFYAGMLEEWILIPTRQGQERSPEQVLMRKHLKALVLLARQHAPGFYIPKVIAKRYCPSGTSSTK